MRAFTRRRGRYVAHIDSTEREILARVVADTAALLGEPPGMSREEAASTEPAAENPDEAAAPQSEAEAADDEQHTEDLRAHLERLDEDVPAPTDPALARLLPDASPDDADLSAEFRRLTQAELRDEKIQRLHMVWAALRAPGSKLNIDPDQAMDWAAALTDVRLVLSERLGIRTDEDAEDIYALAAVPRTEDPSPEEELRLAMASVYSAFTWLQESLVQVMLPTVGD